MKQKVVTFGEIMLAALVIGVGAPLFAYETVNCWFSGCCVSFSIHLPIKQKMRGG